MTEQGNLLPVLDYAFPFSRHAQERLESAAHREIRASFPMKMLRFRRLHVLCLTVFVSLIVVQPLFAEPQHPHLYFAAAGVHQIRTRIVSDDSYKAGWDEFYGAAYADQKKTDWDSAVCERLAFAYSLLGIRGMSDAAIGMLLKAAEMPSWHDGDRSDRGFPWHSGLQTSQMCMSVATAYDWTYPAMTEDQRETIRTALIEKGILPLLADWNDPGTRIHALDTMGHNWWAVCLSGAGVGALALLDEDPRASEWVRDINRSLDEWFRYQGNPLLNKVANFGADGGFYEGLNYADYSLRTFFRYAEALITVTGEDMISNNPAIRGICDFFLYSAYQTSDGWFSVNFGDSSSHFVPDNSMLLNLARRMRDPHVLWYWEQVHKYPHDPMGFMWLPTELKPEPPDSLPPRRLFEGIDWAILRDGWSVDGGLFAMTCGDYWNHAHADAGSFILYSNGKPLIVDPGSCDYSKKEYVSYFVQSEAHNVVLLDNLGQPQEDRYHGSQFRGEIRGWLSTPDYTYFYADATGPYASLFSRNYRHVIALRDLYAIVDDLKAHEPGIFSWLLHTEGKAVFKDQAVTVTNSPAVADLRFAFPAELRAEERPGLREETCEPVPYLALSTKESSQDVKFLSVLSTRKASDPAPPPLTSRQGDNWIGMRFNVPEGAVDLFCNLLADGRKMHENSENNLEGFITDAFLLLVFRDKGKNITRLGMHNGSFLRDESGSIFESFSKSDVILEPKASQIQALVRSQKGARIMLRCPAEPEVILNGTKATDQPWRETLSLQEVILPSDTGQILIRWMGF
ncbi:MAG: heparinase II/III family protein [bacterium]